MAHATVAAAGGRGEKGAGAGSGVDSSGKTSTLLTGDSIFPVKCERPSLDNRDRDSLEEEEDRVKSCSGG